MKAAYDREYRAKNLASIKAKKRAYYFRTFDPEKARAQRAKRPAGYHTAYCRRYMADPARKAAKVAYDQKRKASQLYPGQPIWAECHVLVQNLMREIRSRQRWYERARERGYYDRTSQQRKRDAQISRH